MGQDAAIGTGCRDGVSDIGRRVTFDLGTAGTKYSADDFHDDIGGCDKTLATANHWEI